MEYNMNELNNQQIVLNFEEVTHTYTDNIGNIYTPVTSFIHKFSKPFDKKYWSMWTALKNNGYKLKYVKEDIGKFITINGKKYDIDSLYNDPTKNILSNDTKNEWKKITDKSINRGNKIHNYLEDTINKSKGDEKGLTNELIKPFNVPTILKTKHDLDSTDLFDKYPKIYNRLLTYINQGCTIFAEKRIYNVENKLAGTIDVLIVKGKKFAILDWKTNKDEMHFTSGYYRKVKKNGKWIKSNEFVETDDRLLKPINHLKDCKGIIYSLQLSTYAWMLIQWGYELVPNGLEICHIRPNREPQIYKTNYYGKEITDMLKYLINIENNKVKKLGIK